MIWICSSIFYFVIIVVLLIVIHHEGKKSYRDIHAFDKDTLNNNLIIDLQDSSKPKPKARWSIIILLLILALPTVFYSLFSLFFAPTGYVSITVDVTFTYVAALLLGTCAFALLPFAFPRLNNGSNYSENAYKTVAPLGGKIMCLFAFVLIFPFYALGVNTYAGYNDTGIIYNSYFSLQPTTTQYNEIKDVNRYFGKKNNGEIYSMHYEITLKNGEVLDVMLGDTANKVYAIHQNIEAVKPELFSPVETTADINKFLNKFDAEKRNTIYKIFGFNSL